MSQTPPAGGDRWLKLLAAGALAAAAVGFLTGTRPPEVPPAPGRALPPGQSVAAMPTYRGLRDAARGPNAQVHAAEFARLQAEVASAPLNEESLLEASVRRRARRAYDGAPPTIPHPAGQQLMPACLACHEHGAYVDGRLARAMSHPRSDSCLQCHVVAIDPRPSGARFTGPVTENTFAGVFKGQAGGRAWLGAPPTVPHPPEMRGTCVSCHGPAGEAGLRSSHPERTSCLQCHALDHQAQQAFPRVAGGLPPSERAFP